MQESSSQNFNQSKEKAMGIINELINRAKPILLSPKTAWQDVKNRSETTAEFYKNYLVYMAALGPVCSIIGSLFNKTFAFSTMITMQIVFYGLALLLPFVMSFVFPKIASMCQGEMTSNDALRLVGYSSTASYVGGILGLLPSLSILAIFFSIYSIYLMYLGVPKMSTVPESQAVKFTAIAIVAWIVISMLISLIVMPIFVGQAMMSAIPSN